MADDGPSNTPVPDLGERLLTRQQVEQKCSMSRSAIYDAIRAGRLPTPIRIGKSAVRWRLSELEAWIDGCERAEGDLAPADSRPTATSS